MQQAGLSIIVENQDLKSAVHIPAGKETEYKNWKEALNVNTEVVVTGCSYWHSEADRKTAMGPNGTELSTFKEGFIKYKDGKEKTYFKGRFSPKEIAKLEAMTGKIGTRDIEAVIVM